MKFTNSIRTSMCITVLTLLLTISSFAQAPEKMSYQAVIRDAENALVTSQQVGMQISILQGDVAVYEETQTPTSNTNGLVSLEIGEGTVISGSFTAIDWSVDTSFIKIETDPTGGTNYTITGTSQLLSVPYALYAKTSSDSSAVAVNSDKVGYTEVLVSANTDVAANTAKTGITSDQSDAITANTAKTVITSDQSDAITANTAKTVITSDQSDAITANTAKTGITSDQSDAITANTAKTVITSDQSDAITANTAKTGITSDQSDAITANTAKTVITSGQSDAITANTSKVGYTEALVSANTDVAANTAKTGITSEQTSSITANTAKTGISSGQSDAIIANTAKTVITSDQSDAITANTSKVGYTEAAVSANTAVAANTAKTVITDAQSVAITANTEKTGMPSATEAGSMNYWDGSSWVTIVTTVNEGAALQMIGGVPTWIGGTPPPPQLGDYRDGGVVFYLASSPTDIDGDGNVDLGLVCAIEDQSMGIQWYNGTYLNTGSTAIALGTGNTNTAAIIFAQNEIVTSYAAGLARDYRGGGYTDWFLPSKDELNQIFEKRSMINTTAAENNGSDFLTNAYWSSTEIDNYYAWGQSFSNGEQYNFFKNYSANVRAVRAF